MSLDRLTKRTDEEIERLGMALAGELTFNELVALAGQKLNEKTDGSGGHSHFESADDHRDAGRDLSLAHTSLEDALTRYNSACYRIGGTWKRADPDVS